MVPNIESQENISDSLTYKLKNFKIISCLINEVENVPS